MKTELRKTKREIGRNCGLEESYRMRSTIDRRFVNETSYVWFPYFTKMLCNFVLNSELVHRKDKLTLSRKPTNSKKTAKRCLIDSGLSVISR